MSKKVLQSFHCRQGLWELFARRSDAMDCSVDYLINEAMRHVAATYEVSPGDPPERRVSVLVHAAEDSEAQFLTVGRFIEGERMGQVTTTRLDCADGALRVLGSTRLSESGEITYRADHDPPIPHLVLPLVEGASWQWSGTIVLTTQATVHRVPAEAVATVMPTEVIETEAGRFEALHVRVELSMTREGVTTVTPHESWFSLEPYVVGLRSRTQFGDRIEEWTVSSIVMTDADAPIPAAESDQ